MALQRWGDADMAGLLAAMTDWAAGNPLEQRAAAAALCEPRLLTQTRSTRPRFCASWTRSRRPSRRSPTARADAFKTLRQGLGYCWSVAVAALPDEGKPLMESWLVSA